MDHTKHGSYVIIDFQTILECENSFLSDEQFLLNQFFVQLTILVLTEVFLKVDNIQ